MSLRDRVTALWREDESSRGLLDVALIPAEFAFRGVAALFHVGYDSGLRRQVEVDVPVISIGNLTVGGTGKTPFSRWLVDALCEAGRHPALLHGGYADDEPALHREWHPDVPVYAARERVASARTAIAEGADVLVLDDGFQHRRLARSLDIALVSADTWNARRALLPRGPWREPLSALRRADAVVVMRKTAPLQRARETGAELQRHMRRGAPLAGARLEAGEWRPAQPENDGIPAEGVAVSAIADPGAFEAQAARTGVRVADAIRFADHHAYSAEDVAAIRRRAAGRAVLCTAKDWVKLRDLIEPDDVWVLEQRLYFDFGVDALMAGIERVMQ